VVGRAGYRLFDIAFTSDGALFGLTGDNRLVRVNQETGRAAVVGTGLGVGSGTTVNGLVAGPNGDLYAVSRRVSFFGGDDGSLLKVDRRSGKATSVGDFDIGLGASGDAAFSPSGVLYATATDGGDDSLIRVNVSTGRAALIGSTRLAHVYGLAFGPDQGLIAVARGERGEAPLLASISVLTGAARTLRGVTGADGMFGLASVRMVTSPVIGRLRVTGRENSTCDGVPGRWTFCQHQSGFHHPGGIRIPASDETYAWDVNLGDNSDAGREVYPVAPGRVVKYGGQCLPCVTFGGLLIEHTEVDGARWWSGYVHMASIPSFSPGQRVTTSTPIGRVGRVGAENDHLHLTIYGGANSKGGLTSRNALFFWRLR
jgi:hypothetical protein